MNTNEIVQGLRRIRELRIFGNDHTQLMTDSADCIERLQKELDAAVGDMFGTCSVCKHSFRQTKIPCRKRSDVKIDEHGYIICDFEWRGRESEET